MKTIIDECGNVYSKLTVISFSHINNDGKACFFCKCECGKEVIVSGKGLRNGNSKSCGCTRNEKIGNLNRTHGDCSGGKTKEYHIWRGMIDRCYNPNNKKFANYGGRGIRVCDEWRNDYSAFIRDMGRSHGDCKTIERKDYDGDYAPGNCKWASWKEQQNNRNNNHILTFEGQELNITQWAEKLGLKPATLHQRIHRGWTTDEAILGYRTKTV